MISLFPILYDDEILYSVIARYHAYSSNIDYKDTIQELFSSVNLVSTIEFQSRLKSLQNNLPANLGITDSLLIHNHTLYPFYAPFLPRLRKRQIEQKMKNTDGKGIKSQIGFVAGSICKKEGLTYCPMCIDEDIKEHGEAYFHRVHQAEGVMVCPEHNCMLKTYPVSISNVSRLKFIMLEPSIVKDYGLEFIGNPKLNKLKDVAVGVKYLLNTSLDNYDQKKIHKKYKQLLNEKGFTTTGGHIKQKELYEAFKAFYSDELLDALQSNIEFDNEYNWLKVALREKNRVVHPIRNILLILFLCHDIEMFFEDKLIESKGHRYYPCLNHV